MWSFPSGNTISSVDSSSHDIFTPPRARNRAYSQLTAPTTVGSVKHQHIRSNSQSFNPSPLRRSTGLFGDGLDESLRGDQRALSVRSFQSSGQRSEATTNEGPDVDSSVGSHEGGRDRLFSASESALTSGTSPPISNPCTANNTPFGGSDLGSSSVFPAPDLAASVGSVSNHDFIEQIRVTNAQHRHGRRESESSVFRASIRRALGTSEAYDAAAKAALARRLDELTAAIRASSDLSPLAVASLHTKLDDLEGTLYDPSSSRAHYDDALDRGIPDEEKTPVRRGHPNRRASVVDGDAGGRRSAFGSRFSEITTMLGGTSRPGSPVKLLGTGRDTPTPKGRTMVPEDKARDQDHQEVEEDSDEDSEGSSVLSEDDVVSSQPGLSVEEARAVVSETDKLNEKLESLINNLRARQEEADHIQTLLVSRAERAAQRIMFLQNRVAHLEDELSENDSELAYLRLCLKGIECQVPAEVWEQDVKLWQAVNNFKLDWKAVKARRHEEKRRMAEEYDEGL